MRQPVQVLVYPASRSPSGWEYLLVHRVPDRGGFWRGVTGGLEEGETLAEAAARELLEETGLTPGSLVQIDYSYTLEMEDRSRPLYAPGIQQIVEHVFVAVVDGDRSAPMLSDEHDNWRWCTVNEALQMLAWPNNVEALKRCETRLVEMSRGIDRGRGIV